MTHAHESLMSATVPTPALTRSQTRSEAAVGPRPYREYRRIHLAWNDPDARRAYDREQQRKWRAKNRPKKGVSK
jgi:hypothetical protein